MSVEQSRILLQIIHQHRSAIETRWSPGIREGLEVALVDIQEAGGVLRRTALADPPPLEESEKKRTETSKERDKGRVK